MKKIFWTFPVLLIIISPLCYAQGHFEILIPWSDTSVNGVYAQEMPDGSFLVLSVNQYYDPFSGIPIEGSPTFGSGLIKVSQDGTEIWKRLYHNVIGETGIWPAVSFFSGHSSSIIIPFISFVGLLPCFTTPEGGTVARFSYKTGIIRADRATGNLTKMYLYLDDGLCSNTSFRAFAAINDSTTIAIETAEKFRLEGQVEEDYISIRTIPDSLVTQYIIDTNYAILGGARSALSIVLPTHRLQ